MSRFRELIAQLDSHGELVRIARRVDPRFEMPALMQQVERERRAFLFEQVAGSRFRVAGGLLNRYERIGWSLGLPREQCLSREQLGALLDEAQARPLAPREVDGGPVQECLLRGAEIDLGELPVPTVFELDSGPFITGAVGIARLPQSGELNVGVYRTLVLGRDRLSVNASGASDLRRCYEAAARLGQPMPLALALGVDPALLTAAVCRLPPDRSEYGLAGALRGQPVELVRCATSDLLVPADAEIVIEALVEDPRHVGNNLGEYSGLYGPDSSPVARVTAISFRRDAIAHAILAGRNPEHVTLASVTALTFRRAVADALHRALPGVRDLHVHSEHGMGAMMHVVASVAPQDAGGALALAEAAFTVPVDLGGVVLPAERVVKRVIVVDEDVDVRDFADVEWSLWTRVADAARYRIRADVPSWELERCARPGRGSLRIAIDATVDPADRDKLRRTMIPGASRVRLADYL